jgi:DNA-binding CsgD family transcriptional regulator/PAS domain-containing protein
MVTTEHFSRLVHEIYDAALDASAWAVALEDIASAVDATGCALLISGRERSEITMKSVGADPVSMVAYNDYYGRLDPSPSALERIPVGVVLPNERLVNRDVLTRGEFWNDWANPNDYGDGADSVLARDDGGTSWFVAAAKTRSDSFGTPERLSLLRALVPHMQHAIKIHARLGGLDRQYRDFVAALDLLSDGIAIVGLDGRVIHLNSAAQTIVACGDGLCVRSGVLRAAIAPVDSALDRLIREALGGGQAPYASGGCVAIPRSFGQRPYVVRVVPTREAKSTGVGSPTALVVIVDPEQEPVPDICAVRRLYGLTKTEAEVALRVLDGAGLAPIAEELSISVSTVRTHLKHVFEKTDTHRQAELVRLLTAGLAATRRRITG